jgi:hypothetical protein
MTKPLALSLALALAMPACAEVVALDGTSDSGPVVEGDGDGVVAVLHERPDLLVSDGDRLYWAGFSASTDTTTASAATTTIRSCRKDDCARSVIDYASAPYMAWLEVAAGEVFFQPLYYPENIGGTVFSCPTTGCSGDPRPVVDNADGFTVAGDSIFFGQSGLAEHAGIYQKPRWGGTATLVVEVKAPLKRIYVQGDQLFWGSTTGMLQRMSLSGEPLIETFFDDSQSPSGFSITRDAEAIYWSMSDLTSAIQRCSLAGCPSGPEVVAAHVRMPSSLFSSDGQLYLNVELDSSEVGLVSCSPLDCANPRLLGVAMSRGGSTIATDEQFVYAFSNQGFATGPQSLPEDRVNTSGIEVSSLRRYAK